MKKIALLFLCFILSTAWCDDYLIQEMESLRDSLEKTDPGMEELTLRLADVYFDVSIQEGGDDNKRLRAIELYQQSLLGKNGLEKAQGPLKVKVQFQMARLYEKLGRSLKAIAFFKEVFEDSSSDQNLKRQGALHLAEMHEDTAKFETANAYYQESIKLCSTVDICNYAHYRRAWLLYKDGKLEEAVAELKQSMWDGKGQVREKVLNDYILFLSNKNTDGISELREVEELSIKIQRPELLKLLTEAYYSSGNRIAGTNILEHMNQKLPNIYFETRLLEEYYGFRNFEKVDKYLAALKQRQAKDLPDNKEAAKEVLATLRRFVVQIDAEAENDDYFASAALATIDIYLSLYPNDELRKKMQQGWLKLQTSETKKIERLKTWIAQDTQFNVPKEEIIKLRRSRLSLAQKLKLSEIVIEEARAMASSLEDISEKREFRYVLARELYEVKNYKEALPLFQGLIGEALKEEKNDQWTILAQNLVLDIFNAQKKYDQIVASVDTWKAQELFAQDKAFQKELKSMDEVRLQAKFEWAAGLGADKRALETFYNFCLEGKAVDKSCSNAKVLAIQLKDQQKLVALLERANDEKSLMNEYEAMGNFAAAARLQEKYLLNKNSQERIYFKIALLYELGADFKNRDRVLKALMDKLQGKSAIPEEIEGLLWTTLGEADMLNHKALALPWALDRKLELAHRLEAQDSKPATKKLLMAQKEYAGPLWSRMLLEKIQRLDQKQRKISFYGARSQILFKRRTKALDRLADESRIYLEGADSETRVYVLHLLGKAYGDFSEEILKTPLPEGLSEDVLAQIQSNLQAMAQPFSVAQADYARLLEEELAGMADEENKRRVAGNLQSADEEYAGFIRIQKPEKLGLSFPVESARELASGLSAHPENPKALSSLESFYKERSPRIASYFTGRINSLRK